MAGLRYGNKRREGVSDLCAEYADFMDSKIKTCLKE
jgi:hypothetical protein